MLHAHAIARGMAQPSLLPILIAAYLLFLGRRRGRNAGRPVDAARVLANPGPTSAQKLRRPTCYAEAELDDSSSLHITTT